MVLNLAHRRAHLRNTGQQTKISHPKRRLLLEPFEDRRLLASINWVNEGADDFGVVCGA